MVADAIGKRSPEECHEAAADVARKFARLHPALVRHVRASLAGAAAGLDDTR